MPFVPPPQRKINAATSLLANPKPYDADPIFAPVPQAAWVARGYQYTLTVQWSNVEVQGLDPITVRAHVHYKWNGNAWTKIAGNAWISNFENWSTATSEEVVAMTPDAPDDPDYHP
ncbi:hypothetical protein [Azospirillum argentinense]|uniref:Uncharacterized protein n=1 Tax=Azospirillum brasilense TaxID=192 RepID=A0A4D8PTF8_AZOBR|nr:hypothetical protein [Azospirillum argentinense]QCO00675.1 hypothetical protein D3867_00470 [Azospirillum argentinense]